MVFSGDNMTVLQSSTIQAFDLYRTMQEAIKKKDLDTFTQKVVEIDATINQLTQFIDAELNSSHNLRKLSVEYMDALYKCKAHVKKDAGISISSSFEGFEENLLKAVSIVLLLEYELKQSHPESPLLEN